VAGKARIVDARNDELDLVRARLARVRRSLEPQRHETRRRTRERDWLVDADKTALDAGQRAELSRQLLEVFDSQISGGKRYDLATLGRRAANATFHTSHATDSSQAITWAMDLSPLMSDATLSVEEFTLAHIDRFRADVATRLKQFRG